MANHAPGVFPRPRATDEWICAAGDVHSLMEHFGRPQTVLGVSSRLLHRHAVPIDYVLGWAPFAGLRIKVKRPVLIPRQDTADWVSKAIRMGLFDGARSVLEVGAGSGCISVLMAHNIPYVESITAIDNDPRAVALARRNCRHLENVRIQRGDLFDDRCKYTSDRKYDLIVSNPPYISRRFGGIRMVSPCVKRWESGEALFAEDDRFYRRLIDMALGPVLALEIDGTPRTARRIVEYSRKRYDKHTIIRDDRGRPRALILQSSLGQCSDS